jgi:SAM-dependent methyltransferase
MIRSYYSSSFSIVPMPLLSREKTAHFYDSDICFNNLYPDSIQALSKLHWTPLEIAKKVAEFLSEDGYENILDIGSGVGKFCLAAAHYAPQAFYYGVEQRKSLITYAENAKNILKPENVDFIHGNFTQLDFRKFDHFYFYNSFYENLPGTDKIDDSLAYSDELYFYYKRYLYRQLEHKPKGTRLCTLCTWDHEIPSEYHTVGSEMHDRLKFRVKV